MVRKYNHVRDYRTALIDFLGGECEKCGLKTNLEIHHKIYKNNITQKDIQLLCRKCHPRPGWRENLRKKTKEFESQVTKFTGVRKIIEVPASVRDNFKSGDKVHVKKIKKGK